MHLPRRTPSRLWHFKPALMPVLRDIVICTAVHRDIPSILIVTVTA